MMMEHFGLGIIMVACIYVGVKLSGMYDEYLVIKSIDKRKK